MSTEAFAIRLRDELSQHLTLSHPIFNELFAGERNWPLLRMITLEGYQITRYFLQYIENLHFLCPLPKHKRRLLINMFEEETGHFSRTKNHVVLMQDFIRAQGISDEERDSHQPSAHTRELIDYRLRTVSSKDTYHIGAAAVMIASEGQSLETKAGEARHSLLGKVYNLSERDTLFFSVHQKEDVGHVREGIELVADLCVTEKMQQEALTAVGHTCKLFWNMYDSVARQYWRMKEMHACVPARTTPDLTAAAMPS
jgi:pyrroloquinoline-quinone synthase